MTYVIKNNTTDRYIGVDESSGGYPYDTEAIYAKIWNNALAALEYYSLFRKTENWTLHMLTVVTMPTKWVD